MANARLQRRDLRLAEEIATLFARGRRYVQGTITRALDAQGEPAVEFKLLACLVREGPSTQREIALSTSLDPAGVSRLLDELEARKLVRRRRDRRDRRKFRVEATASARARVEAARVPVLRALDDALRGLSYDDRLTLRDLLSKVLAAHEPETVASGTD